MTLQHEYIFKFCKNIAGCTTEIHLRLGQAKKIFKGSDLKAYWKYDYKYLHNLVYYPIISISK